MRQRLGDHLNLALWLAPVVSAIPLIAVFASRFSPLYPGKSAPLSEPVAWPWWSPIFAGTGIVFDGAIFAYILLVSLVIPVCYLLKAAGRLSRATILMAFAAAGIAGSQIARLMTHMRQDFLSDFSNSADSPLLGLLCGLTAGAFVVHFSNRRLSLAARRIALMTPISVLARMLLRSHGTDRRFHGEISRRALLT